MIETPFTGLGNGLKFKMNETGGHLFLPNQRFEKFIKNAKVPVNKELLTGTVPVNSLFLKDEKFVRLF